MSLFDFLKSNAEPDDGGVGVGGLEEPLEREIIDPNKAAFPCPSGCYSDVGISVRAYFALHIYAANAMNPSKAVQMADDLINELNQWPRK